MATAVEVSAADYNCTVDASDWARFGSWCNAEGHAVLPADRWSRPPNLIAAAAVVKPDGGFGYAAATLTRWV